MEIVTRHETDSASETFEIGRRIGESGVKLLIAVGQFAGLLAENAEKNGNIMICRE